MTGTNQSTALNREQVVKILTLAVAVSLTVAIHYGWILQPLFGHSQWVHAIHGRLCYIPIVVAASWFGLRGALIVAATISLSVIPFILTKEMAMHSQAGEFVEIFFYFALAFLAGWLVDREWKSRERHAQMERALEKSQRLSQMGQMAASVAHEIKNPLASIKGALEIITNEGTQKSDRDEFTRIAQNEIQRIDHTVKEFLSYARPQQSRFSEVNVSALLQDSIRQLSPQAQKHRITFDESIKPGVVVEGDSAKLHQVFLNLALNAIEASPENTAIEVTLSSHRPGLVTVTITDAGPGIGSAKSEDLFDPFYTTKSSGSGLGLAIVKSVIDEHNGTVSLENAPVGGAVANITLPCK